MAPHISHPHAPCHILHSHQGDSFVNSLKCHLEGGYLMPLTQTRNSKRFKRWKKTRGKFYVCRGKFILFSPNPAIILIIFIFVAGLVKALSPQPYNKPGSSPFKPAPPHPQPSPSQPSPPLGVNQADPSPSASCSVDLSTIRKPQPTSVVLDSSGSSNSVHKPVQTATKRSVNESSTKPTPTVADRELAPTVTDLEPVPTVTLLDVKLIKANRPNNSGNSNCSSNTSCSTSQQATAVKECTTTTSESISSQSPRTSDYNTDSISCQQADLPATRTEEVKAAVCSKPPPCPKEDTGHHHAKQTASQKISKSSIRSVGF